MNRALGRASSVNREAYVSHVDVVVVINFPVQTTEKCKAFVLWTAKNPHTCGFGDLAYNAGAKGVYSLFLAGLCPSQEARTLLFSAVFTSNSKN